MALNWPWLYSNNAWNYYYKRCCNLSTHQHDEALTLIIILCLKIKFWSKENDQPKLAITQPKVSHKWGIFFGCWSCMATEFHFFECLIFFWMINIFKLLTIYNYKKLLPKVKGDTMLLTNRIACNHRGGPA